MFSDLSLVPQLEWVRLAMVIDCEGCIGIKMLRPTKAGHRLLAVRVQITNTDPRLMVWLRQVFGGRVDECRSKSTQNRNWKIRRDWTVIGKAAEPVLRGCRPYLLLKAEQADVALAFLSTRGAGTRLGRGGGMRPELVQRRADLKAKMHVLNAKGPKIAVGE